MRLQRRVQFLLFVSLAVMVFSCGQKQVQFVHHALDEHHGKNLVADIDGDGTNEILQRGRGEEALVYFERDPDGSFVKHVVIQNVPFGGDRIDVGDIDGDGDLDIGTGIRPSQGEDNLVIWIENPLPSGDPSRMGTWKVHEIANQGANTDLGYIKDLCIEDFNGDGAMDVVTRTHIKTTVYFQDAPDQWSSSVSMIHESHEGMDVGDLDRDGDPDIVLNGFWFETPADPVNQPFVKHIYDARWFTKVDSSWRDNNTSIVVKEINGDGFPDILISQSELPGFPISLYSASSSEDVKNDNWVEIRVAEVFDFCQSLDAGDIDNDGDIDVFAAKFERDHGNKEFENEPPYPVAVFYNANGDGQSWEMQILSETGYYAAVLGDVESDGDLDIIGPRSYWKGPTDLYENLLIQN